MYTELNMRFVKKNNLKIYKHKMIVGSTSTSTILLWKWFIFFFFYSLKSKDIRVIDHFIDI